MVKDEPVVVDDVWVTSRQPDDLPKFCDALIRVLDRSFPEEESTTIH
jgi:hypothetical protein